MFYLNLSDYSWCFCVWRRITLRNNSLRVSICFGWTTKGREMRRMLRSVQKCKRIKLEKIIIICQQSIWPTILTNWFTIGEHDRFARWITWFGFVVQVQTFVTVKWIQNQTRHLFDSQFIFLRWKSVHQSLISGKTNKY